ncbi:MAG: TetR/AcrR family transcriptional regulator [Bacteroidota bacterium]|nr:TetR/AcrR family transcriptional regulator [Bacteroidota bacterium]
MVANKEELYSEIKGNKKQLIMNTALESFAEKGFYSTSINNIAKSANISKGLIYHYFRSKDELLKTIIFDGFDKLFENFDENKDGILQHSELINYINFSFESLEKNGHFWRLYFSLIFQPHVFDLVKNKLMEKIQPFSSMLTDYFERNNYEDPEIETLFFFSVLDGVGVDYMAAPEYFPIEKLKKRILKIYDK